MSNQEFRRLMQYQIAARHKASMPLNALGRRFAKGNGKGYGFVGKFSRIIPQVGLERYFGNSMKQSS